MLLSLLLAAAPLGSSPGERYNACLIRIREDKTAAIAEAEAWRDEGGGIPARVCLGLAFIGSERWAPAALTFEQAAKQAELDRDARAANYWIQSGNAHLGGNDLAKARMAFDRALALPSFVGPMRGEALLDRARAAVAADDLAPARADIDEATKLVPEDPMVWLLSATLARRQEDLTRASVDIGTALRLAPDEPAVAYEQGSIAYEKGQPDIARGAWERAIRLDQGGPVATNARMAIAQLETGGSPER